MYKFILRWSPSALGRKEVSSIVRIMIFENFFGLLIIPFFRDETRRALRLTHLLYIHGGNAIYVAGQV
jgi:hypothetical protein